MRLMTITQSQSKPGKPDWLSTLISCLSLFAAWLMIQLDGDIEHKASLCPSKILTGLPCMGCGLGKSVGFLLHGNLEKSLVFHPLGWLMAVLLIGIAVTPRTIINSNRLSKYSWLLVLPFFLFMIWQWFEALLSGQFQPMIQQGLLGRTIRLLASSLTNLL
jgi:hypothetical protein